MPVTIVMGLPEDVIRKIIAEAVHKLDAVSTALKQGTITDTIGDMLELPMDE